MVTCMFGESSAKQLDMISMSNDTVRRRVKSIALNVKETLIARVKNSDFFSIQLDESTDTYIKLCSTYGLRAVYI